MFQVVTIQDGTGEMTRMQTIMTFPCLSRLSRLSTQIGSDLLACRNQGFRSDVAPAMPLTQSALLVDGELQTRAPVS